MRFVAFALLTACPAPPAPAPAPPAPPSPLTLAPVATELPRTNQWRQGFDLVDLDHDGHIDLLHGPARKHSNHPTLFRGPTFTATPLAPVPFSYGDVVATDLDHDGQLDLAYALHHTGLVARRRDGTPIALSAAATTFSSRALAAADLDRDGRAELLALSDGPRLNNPTDPTHETLGLLHVTPTSATIVPGSERVFGDHVSLGDVDGDDDTDVLIASAVTGNRTILCRGRPLACAPLPGLRDRALVRAVHAAPRLAIVALSVHDRGWRTIIDAIAPDGTVTSLLDEPGKNELLALDRGDLDGDGVPELVAARADGALVVIGRATTHYPAPPWRAGCAGYALRVADLDGDHRAEVIAAFAGDPAPERCAQGGGFEIVRVPVGSLP